MSDKKFLIKVNSKLIQHLFILADMVPTEEVNFENINKVIFKIRTKFDNYTTIINKTNTENVDNLKICYNGAKEGMLYNKKICRTNS